MKANSLILIVDDEPGITRLCERLLKNADYRVASYNDPGEAIKFVEKNTIELLLVDIRMPEISGFDFIASVKRHQPDIAVLVMTGFGTIETAIQALRQGVDGLLLKPFETSGELVATVNQALVDNQKKRDAARIQALRPLFDITETFLAETQPERLVELVLSAVCGHLRCKNAGYYQFSNEENSLVLVADRGITLLAGAISEDSSIISRSYALKTQFWINTDGTADEELQSILVALRVKSLFCVPIFRLNIQGVLYADRNAQEESFREVDWEMFLLIARQMAVAMENAHLYEELRNYVQRVESSQQALLRAEKMAAAGRLTASIAHEINNPLQAVQNCLHLATREELGIKKQYEYIELANHELERLMTTVQRMLDLYRPGAVAPQDVDIGILLQRVIDLLSPQMRGRNIEIKFDHSTKLPSIMAVSGQLEQVFINLLLNAYDAMPNGGKIGISTQLALDMIEINIQDTGSGIAEEDRSRIFEPFVSTKEAGTGLGLSVSYGIISAHGGSLDLVPDRGPGACFCVAIPVKGET
jgi:signal transduction histidine kinase/FixJ family two-component response regulator